MTAWSAAGGESLLAHGIHYALLVGGVGGLGALLLPRMFAGAASEPRNDFERRIQLLRSNLAEGSLLTGTTTGALTLLSPASLPTSRDRATDLPDAATRLVLPIAIVSSLAAAGAHAAVGPEHFAEGTAIGIFFAICALAQLAWVALVMLHPGELLLRAGVVGNLAVVALWGLTRTVGFPGILPGPEAVGPWDLACGVWELTIAGACIRLLSTGARARVATWTRWHGVARGWFIGSVLLLGLLSVSGASA